MVPSCSDSTPKRLPRKSGNDLMPGWAMMKCGGRLHHACDDAELAALEGVDDQRFDAGDRDLLVARAHRLVDLLGVVVDLEFDVETFVLEIALLLRGPTGA